MLKNRDNFIIFNIEFYVYYSYTQEFEIWISSLNSNSKSKKLCEISFINGIPFLYFNSYIKPIELDKNNYKVECYKYVFLKNVKEMFL